MKVFLHGLDSSNQGTKAVYFRERYPDMVIPNFSGPLEERMRDLEEVLGDAEGLRMVGSSFGGLMAALFTMQNPTRVKRLVLLAPALNMGPFPGLAFEPVSVPVTVVHGKHDEVIPLEEVREIASRSFSCLDFHEPEDDHSLHGTFKSLDWDSLLGVDDQS